MTVYLINYVVVSKNTLDAGEVLETEEDDGEVVVEGKQKVEPENIVDTVSLELEKHVKERMDHELLFVSKD